MEAGKFYTDSINDLLAKADAEIQAQGASPEGLVAREKAYRLSLKQAAAKLLRVPVTAVRFDSDYDAFNATDEDDNDRGTLIAVLSDCVRAVIHPNKAAANSPLGKLHKADIAHRAAAKVLCAERCRIADLAATDQVNKFKARLRAVHGKLPEDVRALQTSLNEWLRLHAPHTCPA